MPKCPAVLCAHPTQVSCPGHHKTGTPAFFSPEMGLPEPSPRHGAIELWQAIILFFQDTATPPVGYRLRDSHKIQIIQAARN
ncbi:hypothetical protein MRX96_043491 [Rhipicephalus microplus]